MSCSSLVRLWGNFRVERFRRN